MESTLQFVPNNNFRPKAAGLKLIQFSTAMQELRRFDILREQIKEVVHALLAQCRVPAREMIRDMIAMEQSYINTSHPDFTGGGKAIQRILQQRAQKQIERGHGDYTNPFNSVVRKPPDVGFVMLLS
jgi:hypothetical protein